jgi:aminodeoxyfutalosine synthase
MAVSLDGVVAKVEAGEPLTTEDIQALESGRDIITLGMLANSMRRRLHGSAVTYVRVADLDISDVSTPDLKVGTTVAHIPATAGEVRIFQTPATLDAAIAVVKKALEVSASTPLSAFCLFELSKLPEGLPVVLAALKRAGLTLITQAPFDRLHSLDAALEALADAGLQLARLTIDGDTSNRNWTTICRQVAAHHQRHKSIRAFAPLPRKIDLAQPTTGYADVRRVALSRILADNVPTIQVDWTLYGPKLAQVALTFGADDIDSVSAEDDDSKGRRRAPLEEIRRSIQSAGFEPIERNARFEIAG